MLKKLALLLAIVTLSVAAGTLYAQDEGGIVDEEVEETAGDLVELTEEAAETTADTLTDFLDRTTELPRTGPVVILMIIGGLILLLAGWRIYDFVLLIASFMIGGAFAASVITESSTILTLAAFLVGGVIGVVVGAVLFYVAMFLIGAYVGINVANGVADFLDLEPLSSLILLVAGVVGGVILLGLSFELVILVSAVVGAQLLTLSFELGSEWVLILTIVGVVFQFLAMRYFRVPLRRGPPRRGLPGLRFGRSR